MKSEAHWLRLENEWLKKEIMAWNGGKPIELPPNILRQISLDLPPLPGEKGSSWKSKLGVLPKRGPWSEWLDDDELSDFSKPMTPNTQVGEWADHAGADFGGRADY